MNAAAHTATGDARATRGNADEDAPSPDALAEVSVGHGTEGAIDSVILVPINERYKW
jgi:hypothetical protein